MANTTNTQAALLIALKAIVNECMDNPPEPRYDHDSYLPPHLLKFAQEALALAEGQIEASTGRRPGTTTTAKPSAKVKQLINKKILHTMVPLSERTIYTLEQQGLFPRRFALSARSVVWDQDDVLAWMEKRKQEAAQASRPGIKGRA